MSEFRVPIVRIKGFGKHPNADTLSITQVEGCNTIFKTGDFEVGDLAIYIPRDAIVPKEVPGTEFLNADRRVRAVRLRGIYSEGVLLPFSRNYEEQFGITTDVWEGGDVAATLGITKYIEPVPIHMRGEVESPLSYGPVYDIENGRKYSTVIEPGCNVVVTEKIHGTNFRACWDSERGFMVGSHNNWWKYSDGNLYWEAAKRYDLANLLQKHPGLVVYGEVFGQVQDMKYDSKPGQNWLRIFDIYIGPERRWMDWNTLKSHALTSVLQMVPVLFEGPFDLAAVEKMSDGPSTIASHFREGVVVKSVEERTDLTIGRIILKWVGETYKLRKKGTEMH